MSWEPAVGRFQWCSKCDEDKGQKNGSSAELPRLFLQDKRAQPPSRLSSLFISSHDSR